jgi:LysM repeat protein
MDAIVVIALVILALVWGFWLIFKKEMMSINLAKLLAYFAGVILTLLIVLWVTTRFLPWWAVRLVNDTRESDNVRALQNVTEQLWNDAINNPISVTPVPPITEEPPPGAPQPTISPQPTPVGGAQIAPSSGTRQYVVQSGDTLYKISTRFNTSVDEIKRLNNLSDNTIKVGETLVLP